jgi:hypothetical protein
MYNPITMKMTPPMMGGTTVWNACDLKAFSMEATAAAEALLEILDTIAG